jgi:signal transduction histidine kinase
LDTAISQTLEHFNLEAGRIYLMHPEGQMLTLAACKGMDPKGFERISISEGFSGKAVRTRSFLAQHVSELGDRDRADFLARHGFEIVICVPLIVMEKIIGVMNLATGKNIELTQNQIDLLIAIGNQVAIAANHAMLYEELQKEEKTMQFIAYSISHDLKNPAVGAYGLARLLAKKYSSVFNERGRKYCDQILKATEQIVTLVSDMNAFVGAKEMPLLVEEINVKEITASLRGELAQKLDEQHIGWYEPETFPPIWADRLAITRVLQNLVDNALKYGGDCLSEIRVGYHDDKDYHILSVSDNGIDIKKDESERIFEMFQRGSTSKGIQGTGLGLAIIKEIAKAHHGKAWIEPEPNNATTFYVSIAKNLEPAEASRCLG